jgi:hypothetical protein
MTRFQYQNGDRPLDGYTIQHALGRGGFGEVYFALSDAGRQVALKAVQNYEEIELRGIGHCMNLKSQHLVSIFDVKHGADGTPWVIMEFVSGPSLRDILDESPAGIGIEKAGFFVRELAKGLTYLHAAGVVHRDLKPHNVFFEEGIVKIGDYSLSKAITNSHRSGHTMTVGTVHYMAPEISMGRYDKTVDIYALGVMLYEMLTGSPPYSGDSMGEVLMKHLSSQPDVSKIQEPFASIITKSMQRDPANRYQTAEQMAAALRGGDPQADSMTGFGPLSLSMVADQQAKKIRPASDDSTGRIDASLTTTQAEPPTASNDAIHPMRQLGRDLGGLAYVTAIVGDQAVRRDPSRVDPVPGWIRRSLALLTLAAMSVVSGMMTVAGRGLSSNANPSRLNALFPWPTFAIEQMGATLFPALMILIGTVLVRISIERGNLPERPKRCRLAHLCATFAALGLTMMLGANLVFSYSFLDLIPVGLPLLIQNWCLLTSPTRRQRLRLWPVLFSALVSFVTAEVLGADSLLSVAVITASALAVQVWSRFSPQASQPDDSDAADASAVTQAPPQLAETHPPIHSLATAE